MKSPVRPKELHVFQPDLNSNVRITKPTTAGQNHGANGPNHSSLCASFPLLVSCALIPATSSKFTVLTFVDIILANHDPEHLCLRCLIDHWRSEQHHCFVDSTNAAPNIQCLHEATRKATRIVDDTSTCRASTASVIAMERPFVSKPDLSIDIEEVIAFVGARLPSPDSFKGFAAGSFRYDCALAL
jgi:hypothetical protein